MSAIRVRSAHDREIAALAVPALGALVAEPLYILADTAVVGRIGTDELAGLAVASSALLTGYAVFIFLAYGTTAAVSRLLGAGDEAEAAHQAVQGLWLAVALGSVVGLGLVLVVPEVVGVLGADGAVLDHATLYLRISAVGVPAQLLVFAGTGYLRGLQDTRTPLVVAVAAAGANLAVELVLVWGLGFGIGASALSTVIAQFGAAGVYVRLITRATGRLGAGLAPEWVAVRRLARAGGDLLVRTLALRGSMTLTTAIAARIGVAEVAAHEIALAVWSLLALVLDALAIAAQAMVGRLLGAGRPAAARDVGRRLLELGVAGGLLTGAVVVVARPVLPGIFSDDATVAGLAGFLLVWVGVLQPIAAVAFVLDGLLIGAGDMRFLAVVMVGAAAVIVPAAIAVLLLGLGVGWVWALVGLFMVTRAVPLGWRWRTGAWAVVGARR